MRIVSGTEVTGVGRSFDFAHDKRVTGDGAKRYGSSRFGSGAQARLGATRFELLLGMCVATIVLLMGLLGAAGAAFAQTETATLSGVIQDPKGGAVPDTEVTITRIETGTVATTKTNNAGIYFFTGLMPGHYNLTVRKPGFKEIAIKEFQLYVQDKLEQNFSLEIGSVSETVTVTASGLNINTTDATVSTVIDRQFVENMPLNGRSFQSLITLTPGVVLTPAGTGGQDGQFSVNGQRSDANYFTVDGVSANMGAGLNVGPGTQSSGSLPGFTAFGTTQSLVSVDALQEFRVQTSSYSAEYGRQPGGQISITTRSGTNQFHGSAFDYLRNDVFDAKNWFLGPTQRKPPERQNDFGGTLGGPIVIPSIYNGKNRTFFFFSYEGLQLSQPTFQLANVPSIALRQAAPAGIQPILNAFPLPNGPDLGNGLAEFSASYSNPSSLSATSIRIDHQINDRLHLFGRYNRAPSDTKKRGNDQSLSDVTDTPLTTQTFTAGITLLFTPTINNEARVNYSSNIGSLTATLDNFGGAIPFPKSTLIPSAFDHGATQGFLEMIFPGQTSLSSPGISVTSGAFDTSQRQTNIVDNISITHGSHQFKLGVDYRRPSPSFTANNYVLVPLFFSEQEVLSGSASFGEVLAFASARPLYLNFSSYGEDTWRLRSNLSLTLGLRWDINPAPGVRDGNYPLAVNSISDLSATQLAPNGTRLWRTTYDNFAPRLGVAYQLGQKSGRETVIRGGFGVFYDTGNQQGASGFNGFYPFETISFLSAVDFPVSPSQVAPIPIPTRTNLVPPYGAFPAFDPHLKLPYTLNWNVSLQQAIGTNQTFTVSYVAAVGRRLLQQHQVDLSSVNPNFTQLELTRNGATSDYNSLQAQFERRLSHGLQVLTSYTWSHALDEDSTDNGSIIAVRGNASFDIRHLFATAVTYDIPEPTHHRLLDAVVGHWSIDTNVHAQSAAPVDLITNRVVNPATGALVGARPNVSPGVPFYVHDPTAPGGRKINGAAFSVPPAGQFGDLGRNVLRGFGAWQADVAIRRQFRLRDRVNLQLRAEAFNLFNHPNFGAIQTDLSAANFGQATNTLSSQLGGVSEIYQIGGPRSAQLALKIQF